MGTENTVYLVFRKVLRGNAANDQGRQHAGPSSPSASLHCESPLAIA